MGAKPDVGFSPAEPGDISHQLPAQTSFSKAIEWNNKSIESANQGDWAESIRTASVAIYLDPSLVPAYLNRCHAFEEHGDLDEAMSDCDTALKFEPGNLSAINYRGAIMARLGKVEAALAEYERACMGGLEQGCENYRKIRGFSPNDTTAIAKIKLSEAKASLSAKNWNGAVASASEAIKVSPDNTAAYVTRSGAYANEGHLSEALADADTAIRKDPDEGLGYNSRGYVYELMKKPRQAILDYEIACSLKAEIGCVNMSLFNTEDKHLQMQVQSSKQTGSTTPQSKDEQAQMQEIEQDSFTEPAMVAIPGAAFEIGKYKVTQGEWRAVMGNNLSHFNNCDVSCPAESVSWNDVQEFIQKLNARTGKQYRLPTEAEWERACYGGSHTDYCGGNDLDAVGWYNGNSNFETHPVGQKKANAYGLYDMTGNVWEWMSDCPVANTCSSRSIRGGSWMDAPQYQLAAYRDRGSVEFRNFFIGFRLARTLQSCNEGGLGIFRYMWKRLSQDHKDWQCDDN
jgi:Tfp pilus assembly protein PilF